MSYSKPPDWKSPFGMAICLAMLIILYILLNQGAH